MRRASIAVTLLLVLLRCGVDEPPPTGTAAPKPAPTPPSPTIDAPEAPDADRPLGSAPGDPPVPAWPRGIAVVQVRRGATRSAPIISITLEAARLSAADATHQLVEALRLVAGEPVQSDVSVDEESGETLGQVRGSALSAALTARPGMGGAEIELLMERALR